MKANIVLEKSFFFALRIVKVYQYLCEEKREYVLSKELLCAGTNIGKHVKEATAAESRTIFTLGVGDCAEKDFGNRILARTSA